MNVTAFEDRIGIVNDLLNASSMLVWDSRTMMPPGGVASRGRQIATLTILARQTLIADETRRAVDEAARAVAGEPEDSVGRRAVAQTQAAIDHHLRIPEALEQRRAELRTTAEAAWVKARAEGDFSQFEPYLAETVDLARQLADAIGYTAHPYDAMLSLYEPGETVETLNTLFAELRASLRPLVHAIGAAPQPDISILARDYPEDLQRAFGLRIAERFGYDSARGRLDTTIHPFEISFTRNDVRITTRYDRHNLVTALQGIMHEAGHGIYEQGTDPAHTRTALATDLIGLYAVGGTSFGSHESQSRLWENRVGRSRRFWELHYTDLQANFPDALGDVPMDAFYRAFNAVRPGAIRTEADEVTYDFHVMLRVDIERGLMDGSIRTRDLPELWNAAMLRDLGVRVANDRAGVLQDIHWSVGYIGSFCTYTIGNVMSAQLYAAALDTDSAVAQGLETGDYASLRGWLTQNVYRHGRRFTRDELLVRATGRPLDPAPYTAYLTSKYRLLYGLDPSLT